MITMGAHGNKRAPIHQATSNSMFKGERKLKREVQFTSLFFLFFEMIQPESSICLHTWILDIEECLLAVVRVSCSCLRSCSKLWRQ